MVWPLQQDSPGNLFKGIPGFVATGQDELTQVAPPGLTETLFERPAHPSTGSAGLFHSIIPQSPIPNSAIRTPQSPVPCHLFPFSRPIPAILAQFKPFLLQILVFCD